MENERKNLQRIRAVSCYLPAQDGNNSQYVNAQWNVLGGLMWFLKPVNNRWLSFVQLNSVISLLWISVSWNYTFTIMVNHWRFFMKSRWYLFPPFVASMFSSYQRLNYKALRSWVIFVLQEPLLQTFLCYVPLTSKYVFKNCNLISSTCKILWSIRNSCNENWLQAS